MAGNRQIFEQAMRQGANYAWDKRWDKAVTEYQTAIAEFPDEASAYTALGQALVHVGRAEKALEIYQQAARLTPGDPAAMARVAEVQERLGDMNGAIRTWLHTADMHLRRQAVDSAVEIWEHLIQVAPNTAAAHERLSRAYAGMGRTRKAIRQYLTLAAVYQQQGASDQATAACRTALELDPNSSIAQTALEALQHGHSLRELIEKTTETAYAFSEDESEEDAETGNPAEMTSQKALTELASTLLEDSGDLTAAASLLQAIDFQSRGDVKAAIESYETALRGKRQHVAAHFNLGLLYQKTSRFEEAISQYQRAANDPAYALGAHYALGECWRALGRLAEALPHFLAALRQLDLSTVGPENVAELERSYDVLVQSFETGKTETFINLVINFLSGAHWEDRLFETRRLLNRLSNGGVIGMAEIIFLPDSERILASMVKSQEYFEQGLLHSASEECLWAIEHAPSYLPLHLHLAKLFMQGNQVEPAIGKYLFVADTFAVRDEIDQAMALYEQVLNMAPMDLDVRHKLIMLLEEHNMMEQAMEHRLAMADAYYELAQIESSREQYTEALKLAPRLVNKTKWTARILHRLADIDMQRLDWRSAIKVYSQLKAAVPEDEKARQQLVELYLNLQRQSDAMTELDELVGLYRRQGDLIKALNVIEELLEHRSEELELHKRAAQLCVETGQKEGAIAHLDAMGELQLQTGHTHEAVATIRAIIALGPENIEAYRQLLEQIA